MIDDIYNRERVYPNLASYGYESTRNSLILFSLIRIDLTDYVRLKTEVTFQKIFLATTMRTFVECLSII